METTSVRWHDDLYLNKLNWLKEYFTAKIIYENVFMIICCSGNRILEAYVDKKPSQCSMNLAHSDVLIIVLIGYGNK